jgi:hypothetical protein
MAVVVKPLSIEQFVSNLEEPGYSFARYGDGTFLGMQGQKGLNCDGSPIHPNQTTLLEKSILDSSITHGMGNLAISVAKAHLWLEARGIDIEWYDCNVMHTASVSGELYPFIEWLRKRRTILLGPGHLQQLKGIPLQGFYAVHPTHAFYELPRLEKIASRSIVRLRANTVLISAGTAAPVLVSHLHRAFPDVNVVDTGSVWDPYVGVLSRKVFRRLGYAGIRKLRLENFK